MCLAHTKDSNGMIVVETIPHHLGLFRRNVSRLKGIFLDCDMKKELMLLPTTKSGGKIIRYSTKSVEKMLIECKKG
jgi:hypothetical protein